MSPRTHSIYNGVKWSASVLSGLNIPDKFILVWEKAAPCPEYHVPMSQLTMKHF